MAVDRYYLPYVPMDGLNYVEAKALLQSARASIQAGTRIYVCHAIQDAPWQNRDGGWRSSGRYAITAVDLVTRINAALGECNTYTSFLENRSGHRVGEVIARQGRLLWIDAMLGDLEMERIKFPGYYPIPVDDDPYYNPHPPAINWELGWKVSLAVIVAIAACFFLKSLLT